MTTIANAATHTTSNAQHTWFSAPSYFLPALFLAPILLLSAPPAAPQAEQRGVNSSSILPPSQAGAPDGAAPPLPRRDPRYRLCASDQITLYFPRTPEFNETVTVQPDGFVSLIGASDVRVAGLTTRESVDAVKAAYAKVLHDPIISIELKEFNKPYFVVGGQVSKPGKYDLRGYTTASQAIAMAGGFNESAKHSQVLLFRRVNDEWDEVKALDLKHILQGHDVNEDPEIRTGDMLFAPQNFISKIRRYIPVTTVGTYYQPQ